MQVLTPSLPYLCYIIYTPPQHITVVIYSVTTAIFLKHDSFITRFIFSFCLIPIRLIYSCSYICNNLITLFSLSFVPKYYNKTKMSNLSLKRKTFYKQKVTTHYNWSKYRVGSWGDVELGGPVLACAIAHWGPSKVKACKSKTDEKLPYLHQVTKMTF